MNDFSINRVALLVQKNIYENYKNYLKGLLIYFGLMVVGSLIYRILSNLSVIGFIDKIFIISFLTLGVIFAGMSFSNLRTKEKGISYLSLPSTALEKLLAELIVTIFIFFIVYILMFYVYNYAMIAFSLIKDPSIKPVLIDPFSRHNFSPGYIILINLQSTMLVGALYFNKRPLIYTFLFLVIFSLILFANAYLINNYINYYFDIKYSSFGNRIENGKNFYDVYLDKNFYKDLDIPCYTILKNVFEYFIKYVYAPVLWVVAYFKLKEKQV